MDIVMAKTPSLMISVALSLLVGMTIRPILMAQQIPRDTKSEEKTDHDCNPELHFTTPINSLPNIFSAAIT
jgi:hypothetical protein